MRSFFTSVLFVAMVASVCSAQQEARFRFASDPFDGSERTAQASDTLAEPEPTRAVASYESQETMSPIHRRAHLKAQQRQLLLASREWYGVSQMRPTIYATPYMTSYTPFYPVVPVAAAPVQRPFRTWNAASYSWY